GTHVPACGKPRTNGEFPFSIVTFSTFKFP
ncbi:MAG: hypothetical protein ACI8Y9_000525, partial [Paracoccaceae bacterium]